ncbi:MAG: hypothetical protein MJZ74_05655 [Muribaculaceae bacterium]|nr:hypothetical protein [Muribaculaceae bacterium]
MKKFLLIVAVLMGCMAANAETVPPAGSTVEYYNCKGFAYLFYETNEWQSEVAIDGTDVYMRNVFANFSNAKWIHGTLDADGVVSFPSGQNIGDYLLYTSGLSDDPEDEYYDLPLVAYNNLIKKQDFVRFSFDAASKKLQLIDHMAAAFLTDYNFDLEQYAGTCKPDGQLTMVGSGQTYVYNYTAVDDVNVEGVKAVSQVYSINGSLVGNTVPQQSGIYVVRYTDGTAAKVQVK